MTAGTPGAPASAPALPLPPAAHAAPLPPPWPGPAGTRVLTGLAYASPPGARPLELDLYLPAGDGPHPVVLFLHGGGWRLGSRYSGGPAFPGSSLFQAVAAAGVAVASADYRLSGEATWPAQLEDVRAAVGWLRSRSGELDVDERRVAAWGESAGGHLALLLGLAPDDDAATSPALSGVVAWYAPSDLPGLAGDTGTDPAAADSREAQLLGAPLTQAPERAAGASPLTYVTGGAPPVLLLHGAGDRLVPAAQSERLHTALRRAGAEAELVVHPGADHLWLGAPDAAGRALEQTVQALRRWLAVVPARS
ncbi:alpha/beta hydrolase fold domain-containing protein [Modestobacter sp. I12A-02628]|uniref:Alpha/beta hydrolase n=1 Tax=Goekera deserti TaxID=2497753 RepID=A0A7K3WDX0_9ACTN|nr:alpha/beta hydrolase [Goekera deserti]MPQ99526.1 alpha/beta hydrolase fold domain-containing protein [Goekera deserti]NDI46462.1 alpha/beta hydrolase fold domain-containing protein [Goekera deserti]NEL54604.1 alpha/beta hydrolase [Goekera deserti]